VSLAPEYDYRLPRAAARPRFGPAIAIGLVLGVLAQAGIGLGAVWIATHEQRIVDQFAVWRFEPTAAVETYADRAGLTEEGRFLFYASSPEVKGGGAFAQSCGSSSEEFGILGCYYPLDRSITLYDVTDDRLDGLEEVVATHEMLHAVWDRMSVAERDLLVPLLDAEADKHIDDPAFAETLAFYAKAEPGERHNELHSIIGTEFPDLSPELEAHYAGYILDRDTVVALHVRSNAVFLEFQAQAEVLVAQLEALSASIDSDYAAYTAGFETLNADIDDFNRRADNGSFTSQSQFDAERDALMARGNALDASYAAIQVRAAEHDDLVVQLDAINAEIDSLNQAINIDPPEIPELQTG
jgi:hypothetical protein